MDSVHNRVPKAAAPPQHVVFCSCLSCSAATEQGLTQQLTREPKAETTLGAAGMCRLPPSTGCSTKRAWSILWGKAGELLCCTGQTLGGLNLARAQRVAEVTMYHWPLAPCSGSFTC